MDFLLGRKESEGEEVEQSTRAADQQNTPGSQSLSLNEERASDADELNNEEEPLTPPSATMGSGQAIGEHGSKEYVNQKDSDSETEKSSISDGYLEDNKSGDDGGSFGPPFAENGDELSLMTRDQGEDTGHNHQSQTQLASHNDAASSSLRQEEFEANETSPLQSPRVPSPKESKPSSSQTKSTNDVVDPLELEESRSEESHKDEDEFIKKGFKCGADTEEEDEELREYWTRALQTSTSTGEIVEEIVKVLKHHQKTHDLLCPVCGSCVTRKVILRKRKRSSHISVDRWYRDPLDGDEVREEEGITGEAVEAEIEEPDTQEIEAFGCLACFSLFYNKGIQLLNHLQEIGPDTLNCLPFFFPPYPWGITQIRDRRTGTHAEISREEVAGEVPSPDVHDASLTREGPDFTCGIGSAFLPDYPWGTTHFLSKGEPIDLTATTADASSSQHEVEEEREDTVDTVHVLAEDRSCDCGVVPNFLPDYPWGICEKHGREHEDAGLFRPTLDVLEPSVSEPQHERERICTCGLLPALIPDYYWGTTALSEGTDTVVESMPETDEKVAEDKSSRFDLGSALLPDYPWGITSGLQERPEDAMLRTERVSAGSGIAFLQNGTHVDIGSAVLPSYPWGTCSVHGPFHEQNGRVHPSQDDTDGECTCGLTIWPQFPWGQKPQTILTDQTGQTILTDLTLSTESKQPQTPSSQQEIVKSYIEQETKIEARITSKTDVYTVTSTKTTYPGGEIPPESIKAITPQENSQTIKHLKLDQTVTVINATIRVDETTGAKVQHPIASVPSTGFALLDVEEGVLGGKGKLETRQSTGYAHLQELFEDQEAPSSEIEEDTANKSNSYQSKIPQDSYHKPEKSRPQTPPSGLKFPSFEWFFGKLDADEAKKPLLEAATESETETIISVLKPSPGGVDQSKSEPWVSVFKVPKPSDDSGLTAPLLSPTSAYIEEIEEVKHPVSRPQLVAVDEAVIDVDHSDVGGAAVGATVVTAPGLVTKTKKETDGWDILKSIVYGGLDISIASIGVTSSAAGGNAITRTVVYMGLATLLSGLIGFYHNVLNLYHLHREYFVNVVGVTLMLHGTVAIVSYIVFGLLSPLVYALSYRETDNRDDKFILCCGVTIASVTVLSLCKAKVSNKRYLTTLIAYLCGGVLAAIIGYLAGEHVADLLEEWGI